MSLQGAPGKAVRVTAIDQLDDERWQAMLTGANARFRASHRAGAGRAFEAAFDSYEFSPSLVSFSDGASALFPIVRVARALPALSMALAMPLGLEGTPVVVSGVLVPAHIEALFARLDKCGQLQISGGAGSSPPPAGEVREYATHVLDLTPGFDDLWRNRFSGKNRNMCRKAERAGVSVECEADPSAVGDYYALYARASVNWGYAAPPYPQTLFAELVASGVAELWVGRLDGKAIAGALLLCGSHDLFYWSGAMDRDHRDAAPSNAVIRTAIESACGRGLEYFDFGASGPLAGVQSFKETFGAEECSYAVSCVRSRRFRLGDAAIRRIRSRRGGET